MGETPLRYPIVPFDWGDTVMYDDDPASSVPMVEWTTIKAVEGIHEGDKVTQRKNFVILRG